MCPKSHVTLIAWSGANPGGRIRLPEREQKGKTKSRGKERMSEKHRSRKALANISSQVDGGAKIGF